MTCWLDQRDKKGGGGEGGGENIKTKVFNHNCSNKNNFVTTEKGEEEGFFKRK